jgi:hypothetical protein
MEYNKHDQSERYSVCTIESEGGGSGTRTTEHTHTHTHLRIDVTRVLGQVGIGARLQRNARAAVHVGFVQRAVGYAAL